MAIKDVINFIKDSALEQNQKIINTLYKLEVELMVLIIALLILKLNFCFFVIEDFCL